MIDDHDNEQRCYGDSTILEPIVEQHDDEISHSPMSHSLDDEIQQFEALEKEFASNRHGIRVKFAYSLDEDGEQIAPTSQTTVVKTEPFFHVQASEDQITKHFYENEFPVESQPSPDSLEEEGSIDKKKTKKQNGIDRISLSSPGKSILKKTPVSRSPSPSSAKKNLQTNDFSYVAEMIGKQRNSSETCPVRSLFEPTMNIFDSTPALDSCATRRRRRPSRLQYYIKPYRGEANLPADKTSEQRSRSLTNHFPRAAGVHANRKQHVSWSPVRAYIYQGREKKKKDPTQTNASLLASRSSSSPCLPSTSSSTTPVPLRARPSRFPSMPQHFRQSFPPSSLDLSLTPLSQFSEYEEKSSSTSLILPVPICIEQPSKEHTQTMQRYDRLLEKMRTTDEQLKTLSRSWTKKTPTLSSMKSNVVREKTPTTNEPLISPMLLQMCLIVLVLLNLLVVYFFNEIHFWWSEYTGHTGIVEDREGPTSTYS